MGANLGHKKEVFIVKNFYDIISSKNDHIYEL